jgi:transposase
MRETDSEFHLVVTGMRRDGRRRYDDDSKLALVKACLRSGVSLAGMALKHGVNELDRPLRTDQDDTCTACI